MDGRMLAQLGWVFQREVDAIERVYDYPQGVLTHAQLKESRRLRRIAGELFARAAAAGQVNNGTDAVAGTAITGEPPCT